MSLDQLPDWTTTGIGSLPFIDPHAAAIHATVSYELPFRPQLTKLDGEMVNEWLGGEAEWGRWTRKRKTRHPRSWAPFLDEIDRTPPEHGWAKLQVTGPVTLSTAIDTGRPSFQLMTDVAEWLAGPMKERVDALAERGVEALVLIDEPLLDQFATADSGELAKVWRPIADVASAWGLHICCEVPWCPVQSAGPDVLSFDLTVEELDEEAVTSLNSLIESGTRIAWGVIRPDSVDGPREGLMRLEDALAKVPAADERSLITASCGSGTISPEREVNIAMGLRSMSHAMRLRTSAKQSA